MAVTWGLAMTQKRGILLPVFSIFINGFSIFKDVFDSLVRLWGQPARRAPKSKQLLKLSCTQRLMVWGKSAPTGERAREVLSSILLYNRPDPGKRNENFQMKIDRFIIICDWLLWRSCSEISSDQRLYYLRINREVIAFSSFNQYWGEVKVSPTWEILKGVMEEKSGPALWEHPTSHAEQCIHSM